MMKQVMTDDKLTDIIDIARLAPSVHNTQPWLVSKSESGIKVQIDEKYKLGAGDPTGRQTIISLGVFCEAIKIAAEANGFKVDAIELASNEAMVKLSESGSASRKTDSVDLLKRRCSDRSMYKRTEVNPDLINSLKTAYRTESISVQVVTDEALLEQIAELTSKGIGLALSSPQFREELSRYLINPKLKSRGISLKSMYIPKLFELSEVPLLKSGLSTSLEASFEKKRWQSASGVVVILGDGDLSKYWLEAGRTYLNLSLLIEKAGLSQATSAAIVEASTYHEDIEESLKTNQRILAMIRIGQGRTKRYYSPRVKAEELITSS